MRWQVQLETGWRPACPVLSMVDIRSGSYEVTPCHWLETVAAAIIVERVDIDVVSSP
jgi:hypothetical protein